MSAHLPVGPAASAPRLFLSERLKRRLSTGTLALGALAVGLWLAGMTPGVGAPFVLAGVCLGVVAVAGRVALAWSLTPRDACAFCRKPRAKVDFLIAAESVSICGACTPLALGAALEQMIARKASWSDAAARLAEALPPMSPRALSTPVLELALSAVVDPELRKRRVARALAMENDPVVIASVGRLPEAERTRDDWLFLSLALGHEGRWIDALEANARARALAVDRDLPMLANNQAWFQLHAGELATPAMLAAAAAQAEARAAEATAARVKAAYLGTLAAIESRRGEHGLALEALAKAERLSQDHPMRVVLQGEALLGLGRLDEAAQTAAAARTRVHPESAAGRRLAELLARIDEARGTKA